MNFLSALSIFNTLGSILLAILILLVMITVHEFGHYLAGKALKFKINEFAIGFGPKLIKHTSKKSGEVFSLRALPLGGFCAFEGEEGEAESADAFNSKPVWKRIIVFIAGPLMNYVLALFLIIICFLSFGQMLFKINAVAPADEGYANYSLSEGDLIYEVDGRGIYLTADFIYALKGKQEGDIVKIKVINGEDTIVREVKLRTDCDFKSSAETSKLWRAIGVGIEERDGASYFAVSASSYKFSFFQGLGRAFAYSFKIAGTIFRTLGELLTGRLGFSAMGGPVTTIKITSQIASQSLQSFFEIAAYIGVNLAVFNLLPIPALDGSKVVFCLIEGIFKKPVPRKIEAVIHAVGFVIILGFAVLVDILQFI